jgi:magnesium transporter
MLPGTPVYTGTVDITPTATCVSYSETGCTVKHFNRLADFTPDECKDKYWLHVCGLNQAEQIAASGKKLHLHPLLVEDILNVHQQPGVEDFDNCTLVILKYFNPSDGDMPEVEQISLVLAKNCVLSFRESNRPLFSGIRKALDNNTGKVRSKGSDHLFALLLDSIVDSYLPEIDKTEELLVNVENQVLNEDAEMNVREMILHNRKRYQVLKRAILPLKESFHRLMRIDHDLVEKPTIAYLRDVCDHINFVSQSIDSYHEMILSLMNLYTSSNDLRMNRSMQRLTIVSTVFIPLSFLAAVWGMNFEIMPELQWRYGYLAAWTVLSGTGIGIWMYLKRKY